MLRRGMRRGDKRPVSAGLQGRDASGVPGTQQVMKFAIKCRVRDQCRD